MVFYFIIGIFLINFQGFAYESEISHPVSDRSQNVLIERILQFLPEEAHKNIDTKGLCNGLTSLWAYAKYLSDQPNSENKERDDYAFFKTAENILLTKSLSQYSPHEKLIVDRFIQHVVFFQKWAFRLEGVREQLDLEHTLEDTKGRKIKQLLKQDLICTKEILEKRLSDFTKKPGTMFFIGVKGDEGGHITSLYTNRSSETFFYDPNASSGDQLAKDLNHLCDLVWEATNINQKHAMSGINPRDLFFRNLVIFAYSFTPGEKLSDINLTAHEKEEMLKNRFLGTQFKELIETMPTRLSTSSEAIDTFEKEFGSLPAIEQEKQIHSYLLQVSLKDPKARIEMIKALIPSKLSLRRDDMFDGFESYNIVSEQDKIEITKLAFQHRSTLFAPLIEPNKFFLGFFNVAVTCGEINFINYLLTEIPQQYRPQQGAIIQSIERCILTYSPSTKCLPAIEFLLQNVQSLKSDLLKIKNNYVKFHQDMVKRHAIDGIKFDQQIVALLNKYS